jgi:hypothetical protein
MVQAAALLIERHRPDVLIRGPQFLGVARPAEVAGEQRTVRVLVLLRQIPVLDGLFADLLPDAVTLAALLEVPVQRLRKWSKC